MDEIKLSTGEKIQVINITDKIQAAKTIRKGCLVLHIPHTTAGLILNENEAGLKQDLADFYSSLAKGNWQHNRIDNNAEAHIVSSALNPSLFIPVNNGELALGTWQSILFVELDGPRQRTVYVTEMES